MEDPSFKDAITICKSIMRNGYDAHVINTQLQHELISITGIAEIDLATNAPVEELMRLFPEFIKTEDGAILQGTLEEEGTLYRFYSMGLPNAEAPDLHLTRMTPTILLHARKAEQIKANRAKRTDTPVKEYPGFHDCSKGLIQFTGLPDETLKSNYILAIRAMRYAANFDLPIENNTWVAIVRASQHVFDNVTTAQLMQEWREVAAENMWRFVLLLFDSQIMHGFLPEIAALKRVRQTKNDTGVEESVFEHAIECMKHYPEGEFSHDWYGVFAMLFHDVGKLYTAEYFDGRWTFYQHHQIGAQITRVILRRLRLSYEEIDLISGLVLNHMRFQFMMTDNGIRRFSKVGEQHRLIQMSKASIKARDDNFTAFNHNLRYLNRAELPQEMVKPLLNGNEIMVVADLKPGRHVGEVREALLAAQKAGLVTNREEAEAFVQEKAKTIFIEQE